MIIIGKKSLGRIIRETLALSSADALVVRAHQIGRERGYLENKHPVLENEGYRYEDIIQDVFAKPEIAFYGEFDRPKNKHVLELGAEIDERHKKYSGDSSDRPLCHEIASAIDSLSGYIEFADRAINFQKQLRQMTPDAGAYNLVGCYEHLLKMYYRLSLEQMKDDK